MSWKEASARWDGPSGHGYAEVALWIASHSYDENAWYVWAGAAVSIFNAYQYGVAARLNWLASSSQGGGSTHTALGARISSSGDNEVAWTGYTNLRFARLGSGYWQRLEAKGWGTTVSGYGPFNGGATAIRDFWIEPVEVPVGVTALVSSGNASAVHGLSWKASADGRTQGYRVYEVKDGGARTLVRTTTGLSASFADREPGSAYSYEVAAYNARGDSSVRPSVQMLGPVIVPTHSLVSYVPPSRITLKLGNRNRFPINIELHRAADDGPFSAIAVVKGVAAGAEVEYVDNAAPAGYASYKVRAVSPAASAFGDVMRLRTITAPLAVEFTGSDLDLKETSELTVTWEPEPTVEKPVSRIEGGWSYDGGTTWDDSVRAELDGEHAAVTAIPAGGRARLRVRAVNDAGAGPWNQTPDFYGFALPPVWREEALTSQNGRPVRFSATAAVGDLGDRGYDVVMRCSLAGAVDSSASGELIRATVEQGAALKEATVYGNCVQATTEGKNPSPAYPQPIEAVSEATVHVRGKNLAKVESGSWDTTGQKQSWASGRYVRTDPVPCEAGQPLTVSFDWAAEASPRWIEWAADGSCLGYHAWSPIVGNSDTIVTKPEAAAVAVAYVPWSGPDRPLSSDSRVQVEYGSAATVYEPYFASDAEIDLQGNELCSLPDGTRDELTIYGDGSVKLLKRTKKVVISGGLATTANGSVFGLEMPDGVVPMIDTETNVAPLVCDSFAVVGDMRLASMPPSTCKHSADSYANPTRGIVFFKMPSPMTVAEANAFMAQHPSTVIYKLRTPEVIDLPSIAPPQLPDGEMSAWAESNVPAEISMRWGLAGPGTGGEEYAAQPVPASSGTSRAYVFPYFDAGRRLAFGYYRFIAWLEKADGARLSAVAESAPLRRDEIVPAEGPPTMDAAGNALVFAPAAPYACDRLAEASVYAYNMSGEPVELSVSAQKTEAGASLRVPLGDYMAKVPYVLGTWRLTGLYDDGSAAYTVEGSFEEKKGPVFEVGGKVVRSHVIEPDGTVTEVFPFAIERTGR